MGNGEGFTSIFFDSRAVGKNSRHNKNGYRNMVFREMGKMAKSPPIHIHILKSYIVGSSNSPKI